MPSPKLLGQGFAGYSYDHQGIYHAGTCTGKEPGDRGLSVLLPVQFASPSWAHRFMMPQLLQEWWRIQLMLRTSLEWGLQVGTVVIGAPVA